MKRTLLIIALISTVHLFFAWYTLSESIGRGLGRGLAAAFGQVPPYDWIYDFVSMASSILMLPLGIAFRWVPEGTGNKTADGLLFYTIMFLNSSLWGTAIYFGVRRLVSRNLQFSIRDLLWLTLMVAILLGLGWWGLRWSTHS